MPRLRSEHVVLATGLLLIAFAAYQASRDRSDWLPWAAGIVLVGFGLFRHQLRNLKFGPGGVEMAVSDALSNQAPQGRAPAEEAKEQLSRPTQPPDVKLLISTGVPVGMAETIMGTNRVVQVTAVNTSAGPLGVNSLGLSLSDGRYVPVIDTMPTTGNRRLPSVLNPQETATVWIDYDSLRNALREERVQLADILAHLADGSTRREPVPDDWRELR